MKRAQWVSALRIQIDIYGWLSKGMVWDIMGFVRLYAKPMWFIVLRGAFHR